MDDFDLEPEDIFKVSKERLDYLMTLQIGEHLLSYHIAFIMSLGPHQGVKERALVKLAWDCYMEGFNEGVCK